MGFDLTPVSVSGEDVQDGGGVEHGGSEIRK